MALLGQAALAMWWDLAPEARPEFEHWHAHEHFPERLGIPGFLRGTRWRSAPGGEGVFVMYELATHAVLSSPRYVERLNAPTPWSTRMMPHHRNMMRSQCHVLESAGAGVAGYALTLRLSPAAGREQALRAALKPILEAAATQPGLTGAHLLRHQAPALAATSEQALRGNADRFADWIVVVCGMDPPSLVSLRDGALAEAALVAAGAAAGQVRGLYSLACSATPADMADVRLAPGAGSPPRT